MKILHTSDLHLGKKTNGISRLEEQAHGLDEIIALCEKEGVQVVVIAGDIFDNLTDTNYPKDLSRETYVEKSGKGWCIVKNSKESVYFGMLPYPDEGRFKEILDENETFNDKTSRWCQACFENNVDHLPQVLVAHLFAIGGEKTKSERDVELGGARAVSTSVFPQTVYTALGHLHKQQKMNSSGTIAYSGSILQYSFDECNIEKSVNIFEIENGCVNNLQIVPLKSGKKLATIMVTSIAQATQLLDRYKDCYVEVQFNLSQPLGQKELADFKKANPNVISIQLKTTPTDMTEDFYQHRDLNPIEVFTKYYKTKYEEEPNEELLALFESIKEEKE